MSALALLFALTALPQQRQIEGIKLPSFAPAYMPGQREIIVGAKPYRDTVMALQYSYEAGARLDGDRPIGGTWVEGSEGSARWSLLPAELNGEKCLMLKTEGTRRYMVKSQVIFTKGLRNYWLAEDGRILRQQDLAETPEGSQSATCDFGEDSIEITLNEGTKEQKTTLFPGPAMERLQAQFRPMLSGSEVKITEKRFAVLNPFRGGYDDYVARRISKFGGSFMNIKFSGHTFEIAGPAFKQRVFVSDEGDLVKVDFPSNRSFVLTTAPESKEDGYWKAGAPVKKGGG